jgi:hypothetical protein
MKMPPLAVVLILLSGCAYHPLAHHFTWTQRAGMQADNASKMLKSETSSLNAETNEDFRKMNE